jgi:hypothetical protein
MPNAANLSTAQTGNGASTNVVDRGAGTGAALLTIVTTIGATPTVTIAIEGSADGTTFFPVAYATAAAPETVTVAAVVITTATSSRFLLRPGHPWRYLRLTYSANTNVTSTADLVVF